MRRTMLLSLPVLAFAACDTAVEPLAPAGALLHSVQAAESGGYGATVLPGGVLSGTAHLVVDDAGVVVGSIMHASGSDRAARWVPAEDGSMTGPDWLGTLPAPFDRADHYVQFTSSTGDLVLGYATNSQKMDGWLWTPMRGMALLPATIDGRVWPRAANDQGVIVGDIRVDKQGGAETSAVVWLPPYDAEPIVLPRMEGYWMNSAHGITNDGVVTGWVRGSGMIDRLVQWQIGAGGTVLSGPVMLEGIDQILVRSVSRGVDVVGSYHGNGEWEPYLFRADEGEHIDLGLVPGRRATAAGVTSRSPDGSVLVVGRSWSLTGSSGDRPLLWSVDGSGMVAGPVDLGVPADMVTRDRPLRTSAFSSAAATAVNSGGWAVGWSRRDDRTFFATLWRPGKDGGDGGETPPCKPHPRTGVCR